MWCKRRFLTSEIVWQIKSSHLILDPLRQVQMEANVIWYFDRTRRVLEKTLECLEDSEVYQLWQMTYWYMEKIKQSTMTIWENFSNELLNVDWNWTRRSVDSTWQNYQTSGTSSCQKDHKKVCAIRNMKAPRNIEEVRRFLGHVNYMAKFMPNLSAGSEPLRRLLNLPDKFCWGGE